MIQEAFLINSIKPAIDYLIENTITPKLNQLAKNINLKYNELLIPKGEHFEEYLYRTYKKHSIINTLIFKNKQVPLKDLYIPLTIYKDDIQNKDNEKTCITGYPVDLLNKYNKILITDTAGMGKSTVSKRIFLDIIDNGYGIPIYIEMRRLSSTHPISTEIKEQIDSLNKEFDRDLFYRFIQTGEFIFILDGFDEISLKERNHVINQIQDFISHASNNKFLMTSRPEDSLACFGDFQSFKINSLIKSEAYELLRKYDSQGETSKLLITELKTGKYEMINEFLKNPLLVSLLFAAFDYKQTIPLKKHVFYRQVYDAYFDSHDLSKGGGYMHEKKSGLDIDDFDRVLRHVGFKCLKYQKIEFEKDTLLKIINEAKEDSRDLNFGVSDFFYDILHSVPLFCNDGQYYKWVHKSIQEYFAAQFIYKDAKENQDAILSTMYRSINVDKYFNLLDIYYDIDNWGFAKNITKSICEEFCLFYEEKIKTKRNTVITQENIDDRIGLLFLNDTLIVKYHHNNKNNITDQFNQVWQIFEEHLKKKATGISLDPSLKIFTACYIHPLRALVKLIHNKHPLLYKQIKHNKIKSKITITKEQPHIIDLNSFDIDNTEYATINLKIAQLDNLKHVLDYNACKQEIQKIHSILSQKSIISAITDGL